MKVIVLCFSLLSFAGIFVREYGAQSIPASILECYNTTNIQTRDNRLPQNIHSLIAIVRKIENTPGLNMDLRTLSAALLHRFRLDGIERDTSLAIQDGIIPFSPTGFSLHRNSKTLELVTGNAVAFPNSSLTLVERCTLHYMLSSSIELQRRGDESTVCNLIGTETRTRRDVEEESVTEPEAVPEDAESLAPAEPVTEPSALGGRTGTATTQSACPVENGVISTSWGAVSAGPVIAGVASALAQQIVPLSELMNAELIADGYANGSPIHNRWLATLAGDLAEVALRQMTATASRVGVRGNFNTTILPKWYFITSPLNFELTDAEIRGDLDGLILADSAARWYSQVPNLRLSQILDMYYSSEGSFNSSIQACRRRAIYDTVAANTTLVDQAISASLLLHQSFRGHIIPNLIRNFASAAAVALNTYVSDSLTHGLTCHLTGILDDANKPSAHLTIILDTNWPFTSVQSILAPLLEEIQVGMYNSNFTLLNGFNGDVLINSTNTLLDIYNFNATRYNNITSGLDLPRALDSLQILQTERLNREQTQNIGGTNSDVVLVLSHLSTLSDTDRAYCEDKLRTMREQVPDAEFLYVINGAVGDWSSLAVNATTDIFNTSALDTANAPLWITSVVSRIKEVPKRLINSNCGASFSSSGSSPAPFIDYIQPGGINYYRLHPNYFSSGAIVSVTTTGFVNVHVCTSRTIIRPNSTFNATDVSCTTILDSTHSVSVSCDDPGLIRSCQPLYLSVERTLAVSTVPLCTDPAVCRYPGMTTYTISYENLVCRSSAGVFLVAPVILILTLVLNFVK